ncbi:MAG: ubiquinone biosynthesis protein [Abditibacteriota bacterium]|nr:ubiquinone biosynthesis protein [Abditibacteriota bacterium]
MLTLQEAKLARHLRRSREIAHVLARHGFDWLQAEWELGGVSGSLRRWLGRMRVEPLSGPEHVRLALEELGPTFIKLGQALSTRPDLVPPDYIAELAKLQDSVTPAPYSAIATIIEHELGQPPERLFSAFETKPQAAASIGQVHRARLLDGCRVVVKVQRPGVDTQVIQDLAILSDLAQILARRDDWRDAYDFQGWVEEFSWALCNELDFSLEGRNADRMRRNFEDDPAVHIPRVYWEYTTARVLVQEEIQGIKISDLTALEDAGHDRRELAARCAHIALLQIFQHGFFHADPHPGNFFIEANGTIGLIDFGQVGRLDTPLREVLLRLMMAISRRDADRLVDELLALGASRRRLNRNALKRDLDHVIYRYSDRSPREISSAQVLTQVTAIALQHRLQLPAELTLLAKVVAMDEGLGAQLDPNFHLMEFARPYFEEFWLENLSPAAVAHRIKETSLDVAEVGQDLPRHVKRLLLRLERGEISFEGRLEESRTVVKHLHRAANRISLSVLLAGAMIGLSTVIHAYRPGSARSSSDQD